MYSGTSKTSNLRTGERRDSGGMSFGHDQRIVYSLTHLLSLSLFVSLHFLVVSNFTPVVPDRSGSLLCSTIVRAFTGVHSGGPFCGCVRVGFKG